MEGVQWLRNRRGLQMSEVVKMRDVEDHRMVLGHLPLLIWGQKLWPCERRRAEEELASFSSLTWAREETVL